MTQTADLPLPSARPSEFRLVAGVCSAHFVSHFYIILLAPLFIFVREDFGVSYTELGFALTAFNVVSAVFQTPVGFLIDRVGARIVLICGLLLGAAAYATAGFVSSFWIFVAMFALAGLGNTVYHPADYALLSQHVAGERMGQVFSYHTFAGLLGSAVAPAALLFLQSLFGWRGAFVGAALLGLVVALLLILQRDPGPGHAPTPGKAKDAQTTLAASWRILVSPVILLNFVFFILLSVTSGGFGNYLVVSLGALHNTPPALSNTALTGFLAMSAIGVLLGGVIAGRTARHTLVSSLMLLVMAAATAFVGLVDPGALLLVLVISIAGLVNGMAMPSRDMIVRAATPPGAFGRVFGFVTTGFNIGGMISPVIFGQMLDHGHPAWIYLFTAVCALLAIAVATIGTLGAIRKPA